MADVSLTQEDNFEDCDEGVFEQGDGSPPSSQVEEDSLPPLLRIQKYAQSDNIHDRQMVWRLLTDLFKTGQPEGMTTYLPLIMNIVGKLADEGDNSIRKELLEQVPNIAAVAKECSSRIPALSAVSPDHLLPMVVRNLGTEESIVRRTAQTALFSLMERELVSMQDVEVKVCPTVLALSRETVADYHISAITLMSKLAPLLGKEVTERVFLDRFSQLCSNQTFYVRKVCASQFGEFCSVVGKNAYEQVLLPSYIGLCEDEVWGVRKECADVAMSVSCACPPAIRRAALAPIFAKLLQDSSRWVRMSAFQTLGPFISTFADPAMSNLFYNNVGELMLVNPDGREFRVKSTSQHRLFPTQDSFKEEDFNYNFIEKKVFSLNPLEDSPEEMDTRDNSDITIDILTSDDDNIELVEVTDIDKKREEVIIQKNFNVVSKAMFGEVIMDDVIVDVVKTGEGVKEDSEDIKEIVETVKNAVLSFRTPDTKNCDNIEECDDMAVKYIYCNNSLRNNLEESRLGTAQCFPDAKLHLKGSGDDEQSLKTKESKVSERQEGEVKKEDGDLHEFNSYNYWYISPEMPVDLSIVEEQSSSSSSNYAAQTDHLSSLFSSIGLDETISDISVIDKTFVTQEGIKDEAVPFSQLTNEEDNQHGVPQLLIDHFISMTDPMLAQNTDNEMAFHCAYSLPAVALTLGSKNWHLIKDTVETLASDMQYKVRRTVASSLHELALILGPDITTNYLTPIFEGFIKDLDEVRIGVLKHLAHFLRLINPSARAVYLPRLAEFLQADNELNWRFRQELAEQLRLAVPLFRAADAAKHIAYIATTLLSDKVAAVRDTALELVSELLRHISTEKDLTHRILIMLAERFAHSKKWKRRQTFTLLCCHMLTNQSVPLEVFASDVMPHLLDLSWDPVPNVRLVVARTIAKNMIAHPFFSDPNNQYYEGLETVMRRLQADKDKDVRYSASSENFNTNILPIH